MKLTESRRGNLVVSVPRTGRTWIILASSAVAVLIPVFWLLLIFPSWQRQIVTLAIGLGLFLLAWRLLPAGTVEFDARNGVVWKDGRRIARFAEIECVELQQMAMSEETSAYMVELRLAGGALYLGYTDDEVEAASAAARVAGVVGRPVKVAS